ncbi:hypothetical protein NA57DRAFT_77460 [Rhizodiscina lignyota]|uniref:Uncharacterized protein n=1 Tax=Rhizodiscina lignyota TaxID=1504668 RepID=A0A9P4I8L6_9PEZI|nr:hypothetical protein NA57DRAFT_77460 [Rhizodiscina lignyota]
MAVILDLLPRDDQNPPDDHKDDHNGLSGWAIFIIVVVVLLVVGAGAWFLWAYLRKKQSPNTNYPAPRPGGIVGWFNDKFQSLKNRRYAAGAYEGTSGEPLGGARGRRGMDPDEAWDTRVGNEADVYGPGGYYEEQELGLQPPGGPTAYSGTGYGAPSPGLHVEEERGRSRSRSRQRDFDDRDDSEMGRSRAANPFSDDAASSMRGVSPRPLDTSGARDHQGDHTGNSPTERRSMFREAV